MKKYIFFLFILFFYFNFPVLLNADTLVKAVTAVSGKWTFSKWAGLGIIVLVAGFIFFFLGSLILRNQVRGRTKDLAIELNRRKAAEKKLRASEEKYREILENIDDGYFEVDMAGNFTFFNESMARILGYPVEELMGMNNREYMDQENAKKIYKAFNKVSRTGMSTKALDWRLLKKDGSVCFVETIVSLIKTLDQKQLGFRGIARDITDRRQLEDQLRQAQKMESIGTLAGGIAHDFNNLLYMILGNTELALEAIPKEHPGHHNLEKVKTASLKAAGIIKQLLNFSRKTDLDLKPVDMTIVMKDALDFLRSTLPATIDIHKNIPDKKMIVLADPVQINQVLMNICINAAQAMEDSGGSLEINMEEKTVSPGSAINYHDLEPGDYVHIIIRDTGPGISSAIIDRIFDPYFTTKAIGKGSGMGLAVVQGIIKSHKGDISVTSQPGQGSIFTILFPIVNKNPVIETETADEPPPGGNETILFVDDEKVIADMIGQILERLGYTVETKTNPRDALDLFQLNAQKFDLVITDMTMPEMTGIELSKQLKKYRPDIPVIICSGHNSLIDTKKITRVGIAAFIKKPVSMLDIAKTIRKVLEGLP